MKRNLYIIAILFCIPFLMNAQDLNESTEYRILKFSPISAANIHFPSVQFAFEHSIGEKTSMQYELGGLRGDNILNRDLTVFRVLTEYRWYKEPVHIGQNTFHGIGFRFQKQYVKEVEFGSTELFRLTKSHTATGFYYTRGSQWKHKNGFVFEFGAALGVQYYDVSVLNIPEGTNEEDYRESALLSFDPGSLVVPMGFVVLKVGYDFKKK